MSVDARQVFRMLAFGQRPAKVPADSLPLLAAVTDALRDAGMDLSRTPTPPPVSEFAKQHSHTFVLAVFDFGAGLACFAVPDSAIGEAMRKALDSVAGLVVGGAGDCKDTAQWAAAIRVLAALGLQRAEDWREHFHEHAADAGGDKALLPSVEEIAKLAGAWARYRILADPRTAGAELGHRISRIVAIEKQM